MLNCLIGNDDCLNGNDLIIKVHFIYAFDDNSEGKKYISYFFAAGV